MSPSKDTIKQILTEMNPWWSAGKVSSSLAGIPRKRYFQQLEESLNVPEIIVLTGMRRTGKTTIMYQLIQYLIQKDVKTNRILYVQFDHPLLKKLDVSDLIRRHRVDCGISKKETLYLFFDEIHFLQDWAQWIKTLYEQKHVKLFITGSSKVLLIPKAMTHLTGRYITYQIWPLFFATRGRGLTQICFPGGGISLHRRISSCCIGKKCGIEGEVVERIFRQYFIQGYCSHP